MADHPIPTKENIFPGGDGTGCSFVICLTECWKGWFQILRIPDDVYMIIEEQVGDCCDQIWEPIRDDCGDICRMTKRCNRQLCVPFGRYRAVLLDCNTGEKIVPDDSELLIRLCRERT